MTTQLPLKEGTDAQIGPAFTELSPLCGWRVLGRESQKSYQRVRRLLLDGTAIDARRTRWGRKGRRGGDRFSLPGLDDAVLVSGGQVQSVRAFSGVYFIGSICFQR